MHLGANIVDNTVTEQNGELFAQLQGQGANQLIPYGNHVFGMSFDPSLRLTFTVESGKATKVTLLQGGRTAEGLRKP
jgi:hypothetical protein